MHVGKKKYHFLFPLEVLLSATGRGTFAEYVCANENAIILKPANLTIE
jgi:hypothetical protein